MHISGSMSLTQNESLRAPRRKVLWQEVEKLGGVDERVVVRLEQVAGAWAVVRGLFERHDVFVGHVAIRVWEATLHEVAVSAVFFLQGGLRGTRPHGAEQEQ